MSSLAVRVFNRGTLKLLAALAIPGVIIWFFAYSHQQALKQVEEYKQEQIDKPTTDRVYIKNYGIKEVDDKNQIRWQLVAKSGAVDPNGKDVVLEDVKVEYFDGTTRQLKMRLVAPKGEANQSTHYVKLTADKNKEVTAESGGASKTTFRCKQVELMKKNQFVASGGVIIDWPGVAKVSGNSATGSTDLGDSPKDFKVMGNTHAEIVVR